MEQFVHNDQGLHPGESRAPRALRDATAIGRYSSPACRAPARRWSSRSSPAIPRSPAAKRSIAPRSFRREIFPARRARLPSTNRRRGPWGEDREDYWRCSSHAFRRVGNGDASSTRRSTIRASGFITCTLCRMRKSSGCGATSKTRRSRATEFLRHGHHSLVLVAGRYRLALPPGRRALRALDPHLSRPHSHLPMKRLVAEPQPWITKILAHVGLDPESHLPPHLQKRAVQTVSVAQVRQPITTSSVAPPANTAHLQPSPRRTRQREHALHKNIRRIRAGAGQGPGSSATALNVAARKSRRCSLASTLTHADRHPDVRRRRR